jgi:O-antigen/teichoic acid export membrane protein
MRHLCSGLKRLVRQGMVESSMSRTRRYLGGLGFGYANAVLVTLAGLWLTAFLLDHVGQHQYGLWLIGLQIMSYMMLLDGGMVGLVPRETASAVGRAGHWREAADLPVIIGQISRIVLYQMPLVAAAVIVMWFTIPTEWDELRGPITIMAFSFLLVFPLRLIQAVLQGLQDLSFLGAWQTLIWLFGTAITVALVWQGWSLYALAIGWIVGQVGIVVVGWHRIRARFPNVIPGWAVPFSSQATRRYLTSGWWVSLAQIAQALINGTELIILGHFLGPGIVVSYFCTGKLITVLSHHPLMLLQTALPALSELKAGASREKLLQVSQALTQATLLLTGAIICVVVVTNQGFVAWWVGLRQYGGDWLTFAFLMSMLLRHWNSTAVYSLFSFGRERHISVVTLFDGVVTVVAMAGLVFALGPIGAPLGSILGVCLVSLPWNLSSLAAEVGTPVTSLLLALGPFVWRWLILIAAGVALTHFWMPSSLLALSAAAVLVLAAYVALMSSLVLASPLRVYLRPVLRLLGSPAMVSLAKTEHGV